MDQRMNKVVSTDQARVLVIDNHGDSRTLAKELLDLDGYDVLDIAEAENPELISQIVDYKPDLILLDIVTPKLEGLNLCRTLKAEEITRWIPIILMTVSDESQLRDRCHRAGGDDILIKPLNRSELSNRVKFLIEQKRLTEGLDQIEQVIFAIAKAIDNRYPESGNSCTRLANLLQSFGNYLGLSPLELQNLRYAAYLHDIGTVGIPDEIMLKKGTLNPEERAILEQHVLIGEEICQALPNRRGVLPIIRHHHERWDGTGYPDGLNQEEIPWLAQVFQILDIYVALTSKRPHKDCLDPEKALAIIQEEGEKGWRNPALVTKLTEFMS
jgi:putative two-component system response regulator